MNDETAVTVLESNALEAITRGEIDIQIATAHKFPRSLSIFNKRAADMIAQDEETASSCLYARPVGKDKNGKQKYAEGMSVRMAEIVGSSFGNLRAGAMLIEQTERQVKARGFAHDLENNFASASEVIESTVDSEGRPYSERMRVVTAKATLAKARRDAIFQVVPKALCKKLEDLARKTAIGDATTLEKRRNAVMEWIGKLGIPQTRVFIALGIEGIEDIGIKELEILTGLKTAIKEGDTTIDEAFPSTTSKPTVSMPKAISQGKDTAKAGSQELKPLSGQNEAIKPDTPKVILEADYAKRVGAAVSRLHDAGIDVNGFASALVKSGCLADPMRANENERQKVLNVLYGLLGEVDPNA